MREIKEFTRGDCWLALAWGGIGRSKARELFARLREPIQTMSLERSVFTLGPDWNRVADIKARVAEHRIETVDFEHPHYPDALKSIADPPPVLFVQGDLHCLGEPQVAIVGARRATPQGLRVAEEFATQLVEVGLTITSGLAFGIDGAAHRGALGAGGQTLAVLGNGLDTVYPPSNRKLADAIRTTGLLVSEYPPGTPPRRHHFPARNRLISGLSMGVIIVEAGERSGSLITARSALEQGREVFAVPGPIDSVLSRGGHRLIKEGASLTESPADVLLELAPQLQTICQSPGEWVQDKSTALAPDILKLDKTTQEFLRHMGWTPRTADDLVDSTGLTIDTVSSMLLALELQGYVRSLAGGVFARVA